MGVVEGAPREGARGLRVERRCWSLRPSDPTNEPSPLSRVHTAQSLTTARAVAAHFNPVSLHSPSIYLRRLPFQSARLLTANTQSSAQPTSTHLDSPLPSTNLVSSPSLFPILCNCCA